MKLGIIYTHTNKLDGKVYVGQTWQEPNRRWRKGSKKYISYRTTLVFYAALQKYGWENFESEIVAYCQTQEEMNRMEEFYIKERNSLAPNGYNLRDICDGREKHTQETIEKIREKAKLRKPGTSWNKIPIITIEGQKYKSCSGCKKTLPLEDNFSKSKKYYVSRCHKCNYKYGLGYIKVPEEQKQESFKMRGEKFKEIHGTPEKRQFFKELNSKAILKLDPKTKEPVAEYACAKDAKIDGYLGPGISTAIKVGDLYKGFYWKFK